MGRSDELLARFSFVVENWFTSLGDIMAHDAGEQRTREYRVFTDNVMVGIPAKHGTKTDLAFAISDLALLQIGLVAEGFFARGGVSVGELYIGDEVIFGVALLDAYDAEQCARTPRVVLHSTAVRAVSEEVVYHAKTYGQRPGHRFTDVLLVDEDGLWFINYLQQLFNRGIFEPDLDMLDTHRTKVQAYLLEYKENAAIHAKYLWAARYHNYFCGTLEDGRAYMIDLDAPPLKVTAVEDAVDVT